MKNRVVTLTAIALAATAAGAVTAQELTPPTVSVYRVLQMVADTPTTVVEGMFRVDPSLFGGASCDYTAQVEIKDANGTKLRDDKWDGACPMQNGSAVPKLEVFRFGMPQGQTFTVDVTVSAKDKPKEKHVKTLKVTSLANRALTSDLILARKVGLVDSATASQWNIKRSGVGLRTASEMVVEPTDASIGYYVELYPRVGKPVTGTAWGVVRNKANLELTRFQLQKLDSVASFRPVAGKANLAGLAPGDYNFEVQLALSDTTIILSHPFVMMPEVVVATAGAAASGFFTTVSDEDIEKKYGGAVVWLTQKAQAEVYKNLTPAGKREYLNRMFGSEMPTPNDTKETSSIDAFVTRSVVVDRRYSEKSGRGQQEGWRTDRGRIYLLRGEPNQLESKPSPRSGTPYEIFFYQIGKGLAYVFADDTRMGHYRLVWTNDPDQQGLGGITRVGPEAREDLQRLGIRVTDIIDQ